MKYLVSILAGLFLWLPLLAKECIQAELLYDFIVAQDGSGHFASVQEAVDAVPDFRKRETRIFIRKGTYKEKLVIAGSKQNISFVGEEVSETILTYDDYAQKRNRFGEEIGTSGSASVFIYGAGFKAVNITFENTAGPVGQAVACYTLGDRAVFYNCRFLGFQDTLYAAGEGARQYFENCYIEGTTDFIFGSATAWFEQCRIHCKKNSYITAANTPEATAYGYIFNRCTITGDEGVTKMFLGRPWRPFAMTVFMNCELPAFIHPDGWDNWRKESNEQTARYAEYNNKGTGATTDKRVPWIKLLTDSEARKITLDRVMKGTDKWLPFIAQTDTLSVPAFPGAEGGGMYTTGGRGGKTYFVTSLEDTIVGDKQTRSGTLRWCVKQEGAKIILFRVAGIIRLTRELDIESNTSLLGHSAPGDGICIADNTVNIEGDNIIVRYLRFRMGDLTGREGDALTGQNSRNVIIDHCSISWATDECASFYDNENFTMQWCIISESLRKSVHQKGTHGYGAIWGGKKASFHHNLIACHDSRNPRFCGSRYSGKADLERVDFRNNVIYNWGHNSAYAGEGGQYNLVNNYYKAGKESGNKDRIFQPNADDGKNRQQAGVWGRFYVQGNYVDGYPGVTADNALGFHPNPKETDKAELLVDAPFPAPPVKTESAQEAYRLVLDNAGAAFRRDKTDKRIVNEVRKGVAPDKAKDGDTRLGLINSQQDVGGWDVYSYKASQLIADSNHDGIPDGWLEKYFPGKEATDCNEEGYTYLEVYWEQLIQ